MKKCHLISILLFAIVLSSAAQKNDGRTPLAILPFVASSGAAISNMGNLNTIQEAVTKEFSDKGRFNVLDRSKFDQIVKELNIQKSEEFLNSRIVEQGKQMGAQFLVAGVVNELKVARNEKDITKNLRALKGVFGQKSDKKGESMESYQASLRMAFAVINVETGQLIYNQPMNLTTDDLVLGDTAKSITKVLVKMQGEVEKQIKSLFTVRLKILQVDKVNKQGAAETVYINGGGTVFTVSDRKPARIAVYLQESIAGLKHEKQIGEIRVSKVEGEVVSCVVTDGGKEIQDNMSNSDNMQLRVITEK